MCIVVNKNTSQFDVYIGRGSMWGNPYIIGKHGNREQVIKLHKQFLHRQYLMGLITDEDLLPLVGKRLGCFCKPLACHGDNIVELINKVLI